MARNIINFNDDCDSLHFNLSDYPGLRTAIVYAPGKELFPEEPSAKYLYLDTNTATLYYYNTNLNDYVPIAGSQSGGTGTANVVRKPTIYELPNIGDINTVYFTTNDNGVYRWDDQDLKYYCCGRDYNEIQSIYGGNASEKLD